jgi:DNA polymerase III subunit delta'
MSLDKTDRPAAISELAQIVRNKKIPNALLFTGNPGAGRHRAALWLAKALNCAAGGPEPCNRCRSCTKITGHLHPDMIRVGPADSKKAITISQIRQISAVTATRPHEAAARMVLISSAHQMNLQAQNALLKALEEPPGNTFFILAARDTAGLLPTILSRCRHLHFFPLTGRALAAHLAEHWAVDERSARIAAGTAGTDLDLALTLIGQAPPGTPGTPEDPDIPAGRGDQAGTRTPDPPAVDWPATRTWLIGQLCTLIAPSAPRQTETALRLSMFLSQAPDFLNPGLAVMRAFFRDLWVFGHAPEKIVNLDFFDFFQDINTRANDRPFLTWMADLHETERRLLSNSSARMALDRFFLKLIHR